MSSAGLGTQRPSGLKLQTGIAVVRNEGCSPAWRHKRESSVGSVSLCPRTKADLPGIGNAAACAISCENSGDRQNFRRSDKSRALDWRSKHVHWTLAMADEVRYRESQENSGQRPELAPLLTKPRIKSAQATIRQRPAPTCVEVTASSCQGRPPAAPAWWATIGRMLLVPHQLLATSESAIAQVSQALNRITRIDLGPTS